MQSTGQGATHSAQPVQVSGSTVCRKVWAPTMASTGHAGRHRAQPMQRVSSITATGASTGAGEAAFLELFDKDPRDFETARAGVLLYR